MRDDAGLRTTDSIDIVIPVLDEESTLKENIAKVVHYASVHMSGKYSITITIADNGSTDSTQDIGLSIARDDPEKVRYLRLDRRGVGLALKTAWQSSDADIVGYMDLDLATDLSHLQEALDAITVLRADIVYGSRLSADSVVVGRTARREVISRVFNALLRRYLDVSFTDGMCGFKFLKRRHVDTLMDNGAVSDGWFFCTEILVVAEWQGLLLSEIPVRWVDAPESKVKVARLAREYLLAMQQLKARRSNLS